MEKIKLELNYLEVKEDFLLYSSSSYDSPGLYLVNFGGTYCNIVSVPTVDQSQNIQPAAIGVDFNVVIQYKIDTALETERRSINDVLDRNFLNLDKSIQRLHNIIDNLPKTISENTVQKEEVGSDNGKISVSSFCKIVKALSDAKTQ